MTGPPARIDCIECGGIAHLISYPPHDDDPLQVGLHVTYRCEDCLDRFDLVWDEDGDLDPSR